MYISLIDNLCAYYLRYEDPLQPQIIDLICKRFEIVSFCKNVFGSVFSELFSGLFYALKLIILIYFSCRHFFSVAWALHLFKNRYRTELEQGLEDFLKILFSHRLKLLFFLFSIDIAKQMFELLKFY